MRNFKLSYLSILLVLFLGGKIHSSVDPFGSKPNDKNHKKEIRSAQKITRDTGDENSPIKRKIKKRGLPRAVPQIEGITFRNVFIYKPFKPSFTESVNPSLHYCVSLTRGPPIA